MIRVSWPVMEKIPAMRLCLNTVFRLRRLPHVFNAGILIIGIIKFLILKSILRIFLWSCLKMHSSSFFYQIWIRTGSKVTPYRCCSQQQGVATSSNRLLLGAATACCQNKLNFEDADLYFKIFAMQLKKQPLQKQDSFFWIINKKDASLLIAS